MIKYALFIPIHKAFIVIKFAELFFKYVKCCFETPRGIMFDKNSCITSEFWRDAVSERSAALSFQILARSIRRSAILR